MIVSEIPSVVGTGSFGPVGTGMVGSTSVTGVVEPVSAMVVVVNFLVDLLYAMIDPRIKASDI